MSSTQQIGKLGEQIALDYLTSRGIQAVEKNYRTKFGEIDLIARQANKIIFIEVKTRVGIQKGKPYEAVTKRKYAHLKLAGQFYVLKKNLKEYKLSIHVVSIVLTQNFKVEEIKHFENVLL
jgi:putative endonuclease